MIDPKLIEYSALIKQCDDVSRDLMDICLGDFSDRMNDRVEILRNKQNELQCKIAALRMELFDETNE